MNFCQNKVNSQNQMQFFPTTPAQSWARKANSTKCKYHKVNNEKIEYGSRYTLTCLASKKYVWYS